MTGLVLSVARGSDGASLVATLSGTRRAFECARSVAAMAAIGRIVLDMGAPSPACCRHRAGDACMLVEVGRCAHFVGYSIGWEDGDG